MINNNSLKISEIFIYPIKSLGGIALSESEVSDRGLKYDRRWMLVDENNSFLTQRKHPQMALINCELSQRDAFGKNLEFTHKQTGERFSIGLNECSDYINVTVWEDKVKTKQVSLEADEWFSKLLGIKCSLVFMPEESLRLVDKTFASNHEITSLSDGYPFLIIGQSSIDDLNSRLEEKIPINRFRPNFVFTGGEPFEEDKIKSFYIGNVKFFGVKQCGRCVVTTVNQETAEKGDEPLRTLAAYRTINNKVMFGMNLIHEGKGKIRIGDEIRKIEYR